MIDQEMTGQQVWLMAFIVGLVRYSPRGAADMAEDAMELHRKRWLDGEEETTDEG